MRGGVVFRPYELQARELLSLPGADYEVVLLRFALRPEEGGARGVLGLSQPTTHVKVRVPGALLPRARTYSLVSDEDAVGYFAIAVKVLPGGRVSPYLCALPIGGTASFTHTLRRRLARPIDVPGRALVVVAFGIGIAECVRLVRRAADAGQHVAVVYAVRTARDPVFLPELCAAVACHPARVSLCIRIAHEDPNPALADAVCAALAKGATHTASPGTPVTVERGRVDALLLSRVLAAPVWSAARAARTDAVFAVGSRTQARAAYVLLAELNFRRRLLGGSVLWGCW
jgi:NAD(P)H-flavin reductase